MHGIWVEKTERRCSVGTWLAIPYGGAAMPAIVAFPQIVQEALQQFGDLFSCAPQRRHFAEYLTGLMVATNKTVSGVSHEFVETSDQSCLNRFLTEVDWDVEKLNERRLQ